MRVAVVISSLAGGGAERAVADMINYWARGPWRITLITWSMESDLEAYGVRSEVGRVFLGEARNSTNWLAKVVGNLRRIVRLRQALRELVPDVVLSFMDTNNVSALVATRWSGIPIVVAERTNPAETAALSGVWRALRRLTYRWADRVVAQTGVAAQWLKENCHVHCEVIPNAVRELPLVNCHSLRERFVLAVGRLAPEKDLATLIRAFAIVWGENRTWRLVLAGEGPLRRQLGELATTQGVGEATTFFGFTKQPEELMKRAAIFVLSSKFEGFPNSLLEAMAMGVAVVSSDCRSGPRELIVDGVNGRLFSPGDVDGLATILMGLMRASGIRSSLGAAATDVRNKYGSKRIMREWERVLREVTGVPA